MRLRLSGTAVAVLTVGSAGLTGGCTSRPDRPPSPSCSTVAGPGFRWPAGIPPSFPMPPGGRLSAVQQLESGFTLVTFTTPGTVRANLVLIIEALQKAGYTVGRGIAGASETRLPFTRSGDPGVLQLTAVDACTTRWQVQA